MEVGVLSPGSPIVLSDGLRAGFLVISDERSSQKEFGAFEIQGSSQAIFRRPCTSDEKKVLRKKIYAEHRVQSIWRHTPSGDGCMLFVAR
jgi:hypothetical protein